MSSAAIRTHLPDLYFHLEGDDHEDRLIAARDENTARALCAELFNEQYQPGQPDGPEPDGEPYLGDEFELLGVYSSAGPAALKVQIWPKKDWLG